MDENLSVKSKICKTKRILIFAIIAALIIALLIFIFLFPALLLGGFFDNPPSENQIIDLVNNNIDTFEDAIEYIHTLEPDVFGIDNESFSLHLLNESHTNPEISNEVIEKVFDLGVKDIYIKNDNAGFFCEGAGRDYYIGIIYSNDGGPITDQLDDYMNESHIDFTKSGDGWEGEWSGNRYYCEKITGNWYYYQTWW